MFWKQFQAWAPVWVQAPAMGLAPVPVQALCMAPDLRQVLAPMEP